MGGGSFGGWRGFRLNKIEILPWDYEIPAFRHPLEDPFPDDPVEVAFYDRIATLTLEGDAAFAAVRQEGDEPRWCIPIMVKQPETG
jgi:hypothetical protein